MKNLLSENMMRFGTKNLSETAQKELVVKSIMETINQHGLQNVIRKKLTEAAPDPKYLGYAQKVLGQLMTALGGADDEQGVLNALLSIQKYGGQPVYDNLLQLVKTSPNVKKQFGYNFNLVSTMIKNGGISNPGYDKSMSARIHNPVSNLGMGLADEEWTSKYSNILRKYNTEETDFG
jgi:hypothetical protein